MKVPTRCPAEGPGTTGLRERRRQRRALLAWYGARARELPFRGSRDPWAILVSEVMAQQTQVARVGPAWVAFMGRFPTPRALAEASTAEVLRAWAGLGYNRRAVYLQRAARDIVQRHAGAVPDGLAQLEALPGVGPYTARAVAAIAYGRPVAAVDTNVRRVISRLLGRPDAAVREVQALGDALVDPADPGTWTHAVMDLGASVCLSREPRCPECPLRPWCLGARRGTGRLRARARARGGLGFERSSRWLRGRIVARLRDLEPHEWARLPTAIGGHPTEAIALAVEALVGEGLVERRADGAVRLPSTPP